MSIQPPIAIALGAIGGALSRYYFGLWLGELCGTTFPVGTFTVNLLGSFLMGALVALLSQSVLKLSPDLALLITVGFLGSFTTFSSYILDTARLIEAGR
ncbi:MAG: fluoride efflux transporter CrcB, partial [Spirulinaceae cyanobacterium]